MKRWVAAAVAVLVLSTATLHVLAHHAADNDCGVCHVQQASLPSAPSPAVAVARVPEAVLADVSAPSSRSARPSASAARAPPAFRA